MSTYAFDIDGTLDRPQIKQLANDLHKAGHNVIVITGGLARDGITDEEQDRRFEEREKQLKKMGVIYNTLYVCIGKTTEEVANLKANICGIYKPLLIFEDTPKYIQAIERHTQTVGLLVGKTKRKPYL